MRRMNGLLELQCCPKLPAVSGFWSAAQETIQKLTKENWRVTVKTAEDKSKLGVWGTQNVEPGRDCSY